jgi:DisA bacterial checkpoint controller nucleotide-binding
LDAKASDIELTMGLGSRHLAAASITKVARAIAVVVSESAIVRIFESGAMVGDIIPELWLLSRENVIGKPSIREGPKTSPDEFVDLVREVHVLSG